MSTDMERRSGTAAAAALNGVKGLGAAVVPSLRSGRQEPPRVPDTSRNDKPQRLLCHPRAWLPREGSRVLAPILAALLSCGRSGQRLFKIKR